MCEQLRLEISKVHAERIEKVERKVSVKLIEKDPSKRVNIIVTRLKLMKEKPLNSGDSQDTGDILVLRDSFSEEKIS